MSVTPEKKYKCNHQVVREMTANSLNFTCVKCGNWSFFHDGIYLEEVKGQ